MRLIFAQNLKQIKNNASFGMQKIITNTDQCNVLVGNQLRFIGFFNVDVVD